MSAPDNDLADLALTSGQAAVYLQLSQRWVGTLARRGVLPSHTVGRHRRFQVADLRAYRDSRR
ncbi:helix-turn-helix domain-containing protein [Gordonia sp. UBA7599]|uniref:helix-turn-helix domain-containing protein n=1 Tax=unclassified Gordonia (in: high G+C Gram-positive bacteria) TaxID=2657482 RepID=UPI0025C108CC|nr:helix-turn-helix domain-containing protein [Gordonia sp. UBA7599]HNP58816.1 helix-turn-helix domain-containing protein [Gordonia sp. (in: high G+C Gram-positive bacteria)]